jgi:hypothetical protein
MQEQKCKFYHYFMYKYGIYVQGPVCEYDHISKQSTHF